MILLPRLKIPLLLLALFAGIAFIAGYFLTSDHAVFFRAYLFAYLYCLGLALGSLCLLMLHNLTRGSWGDRLRPVFHAGALTLPLLAILFIPIALGLHQLYPWSNPDALAQNPLFAHRQPYLNPPFFFIRAAIYFAIWIALALLLNRPRAISRGLSAAGLILYLLTMTHAGIDWIMSRTADFYSTAFGFVTTLGQTLVALSFALALLSFFPTVPAAAPPPPSSPPRPSRQSLFNDLGNVLLTVVILWTYVSFMEFLVIWMGNSHEDNSWYLQRGLGGDDHSTSAIAWRTIAALIILFQFFIPFYTMLFRAAKQSRRALTATACSILFAHTLEMYWFAAPAGDSPSPQFHPHWLDLAALVALVSLWLSVFLFLLNRPGLVPAPAPLPPSAEEGVPIHD